MSVTVALRCKPCLRSIRNASAKYAQSYNTWQNSYGGAPSVVGSTFWINTKAVTITGIAPKGFYGDRLSSAPPDFYLPFESIPVLTNRTFLHEPGMRWLYIIGRVKPGVAITPLQTKITELNRQSLAPTKPFSGEQGKRALAQAHVVLSPGGAGIQEMQDSYASKLKLLMWISGLVKTIDFFHEVRGLRACKRSRSQGICLPASYPTASLEYACNNHAMARIAIVGVGAIGAVIAALLQSTEQHELVLCTRRPLPQLKVETPEGSIHINYTNITAPSEAERVDWVIVATKTYDAPGAGAWIEHLCKQGAPVAIIQNGVEHRERFAPYVPMEQIVPVIIDCPAERQAPGEVHQRGPAELFIQSDELGRSFAAIFHGSAAQITLTADFLSAAWRKLCINSAGSISALLGKPAGVFQDESIGETTIEVVRECAAVGRAVGAILDDDLPQKVLAQYRNYPTDSVNSLLADRLAGRLMETDARIGAIVRYGRLHNIPTPLNGFLLALLDASSSNLHSTKP